jgi:hypothetical protein
MRRTMLPVAPTQVAIETPPAKEMVAVIGILEGRPMKGREFGLNGVEPGGLGRQVDCFHVVAGAVVSRRAAVGRQVVHDEIDPQLDRVAGAQLGEARGDIAGRLAFADAADQTVRMDIIEGMQLFGACLAREGRPVPLRVPAAGPAHARQRPELQRAELVIADDHAALGPLGVQGQNALFLALNSGSRDFFQVLVRCQETPSRRSTWRSHSGPKDGHSRCLRA